MLGRGANIRRQKEKRKKSHYFWKPFEIQKDLIVHCELLALNEHPNRASTPPDMTGERNMCCTCHFPAWVEGECNVRVYKAKILDWPLHVVKKLCYVFRICLFPLLPFPICTRRASWTWLMIPRSISMTHKRQRVHQQHTEVMTHLIILFQGVLL